MKPFSKNAWPGKCCDDLGEGFHLLVIKFSSVFLYVIFYDLSNQNNLEERFISSH